MGIFDFSKNKEKLIAIFDINSASVGGAIVKCPVSGLPEMLSAERVGVNFLSDVNFNAFKRETIEAVKKISGIIFKKKFGRIDKVVCVFSSPWHISQTRIIKINKDEPFDITKNFLDEILKKEKDLFGHSWGSKEDSEFIEYETMKSKINGYPVKDIIGKKAKDFELRVNMSLAFKKVKENIEKIIFENTHIGENRIFFHSFPCVSFSVFKNILNINDDFALVSMGGEFTDIMVVRDGVIEETVSFPRGNNFLLREIASSMKTFLKEAPSILQRHLDGHLDADAEKKLSIVLENARKEWGRFFQKYMESFFGEAKFPKKVFIIGDQFVSDQFMDCINRELNKSRSAVDGMFNVQFFSANSLRHYLNLGKETVFIKDIFLILESIFAGKFLNDK